MHRSKRDLESHTGLRVSEVCALEWSNVDPERRWIYVRDGVKGEPRHVVIGRVAAGIIDALGPACGRWVFAGRRGHVSRRTALATVQDAAELAGVGRMGVHCLRHCFATTALRLRIPGRHVIDALGWKSEAMLTTYQHVCADELRESVDRVAAAHTEASSHG